MTEGGDLLDMKVMFDTSVLLAGMVEPHPVHDRVLPWLKRARAGDLEFFIARHTLAELYDILTVFPVSPRISPGTARSLIRENVAGPAKAISLSTSDYNSAIRRVSDLGLSGGIIHDALIARAAKKAQVDRLLTLNPDDFKRVWPEGASLIIEP
jgi:predicted nucleic acid-binding protein